MTRTAPASRSTRPVEDVPSLPWTGERFIPTEGGPEIYYEHSHRYLLARSALAGRMVVDLASGEGYGAAWIAQVAATVVGVDIDEASVRYANVRYGSMGNLKFAQGDIENLPLADGCADAVTCFEAIEHVPNPRRVVEETVRILKPGGLFFVSTPNKALYTDARDYTNDYHVHEFYLPEFERLLDEFFPDHVLLGQRVIAGSLTWVLSQSTRAAASGDDPIGVLVAPEFGGDAADDPPMIEPLYVIASCRSAAAPGEQASLPRASVLVDPQEILLNAFRRGVDPDDVAVAAEAGGASPEHQKREIQRLNGQLQVNEEQLGHARRETQALRIRLAHYVATLHRQEEESARLRDDLRAATELTARLLAEVEAGQRAIVGLQVSGPAPARPAVASTIARQGARWLLGRLRPALRQVSRWRSS